MIEELFKTNQKALYELASSLNVKQTVLYPEKLHFDCSFKGDEFWWKITTKDKYRFNVRTGEFKSSHRKTTQTTKKRDAAIKEVFEKWHKKYFGNGVNFR